MKSYEQQLLIDATTDALNHSPVVVEPASTCGAESMCKHLTTQQKLTRQKDCVRTVTKRNHISTLKVSS